MGDTDRFLVVHDYGMGGLWWWIRAESAERIVETIAEVEVVTDPARIAAVKDDDFEEVALDDLPAGPLADLRDQRTEQRGRPGYGALAGRDRVYLRDDDEEYAGFVFLSEVGPDGRRLRQVELSPEGDALREDDFPIDPPVDLRDPRYVTKEITAQEFEAAWQNARDEPV
jgi:hypothetical protein